MVGANVFDYIDGKVAGERNRVTEFGAFFDSVMDRISDIILFIGLISLYNEVGSGHDDYVLTTSLAMMFAVMTSYTRARAESLVEKCKVGFMERPERIVLFMIGAFTNRMAAVMWVILVLSVVTVFDRIFFTWRELKAGRSLAAVKAGTAPPPIPATQPGVVQRRIVAAGPDPLAGDLLDLRARVVAVRRDGHPDPRVRLADAARMAGRPDGPARPRVPAVGCFGWSLARDPGAVPCPLPLHVVPESSWPPRSSSGWSRCRSCAAMWSRRMRRASP